MNRRMSQESVFACPNCRVRLDAGQVCRVCRTRYPIKAGILDFLEGEPLTRWQEHYDRRARTMEDNPQRVDHKNAGTFYSTQRAVQRLLGDLPENSVILDAGCGTGLFVEPWVTEHEVYGIDFAPVNLSLATGRGIKVATASTLKLPFEDNTFDVVLSIGVLQTLDDWETAIKDMSRTLKRGGHLLISTLNAQSWIRRIRQKFANRSSIRLVEHLYDLRAVISVFEQNNLCVAGIAYHFFPFRKFVIRQNPSGLLTYPSTTFTLLGNKKK